MVVALLNIVWVPFVAFADIAVPDRILTVPIIAAFAVSRRAFRRALSAAGARVARRRCSAPCSPRMSVQWTVARAVGIGVIKEHLPFLRTAKGGVAPQGSGLPGLLGSRDRRAPAHAARRRWW